MIPARYIAMLSAAASVSCLLAQEGDEGSDPGDVASIPGITRVLVRSEKLQPGSKLWVRNRNGDVRVMGWDREEMHLTAEIRDTERRRIELVILPKEKGWDVETQFQQPSWFFNWGPVQSPRCEMTIFVPRKLLGYFRTTNGSLFVSYVDGYAHCESTNGDIEVRDLSGEVHMTTKNGTIEARDLEARVRASTTNGRLVLTNIGGGIVAETTNGNITARNLNGWGEGISLATTNGSIDVSLGHATGEILAESMDGSLDVRVRDARVIGISKQNAHLRVPGRSQKIELRAANGMITIRE